MSDADKLFLELGYKLIPQVENRSYFLKYKKDDDNIIYFGEDKEIYKDGEYSETCYGITMQELKAINAKVKELRMGGINNGINSDNFYNMSNNYLAKYY